MELINRELSWLSFNERVLQEALDDAVPIIERMRFLGIYSNNMDEFFRVRVAFVRRMIALNKKKVTGFYGTPAQLFDEIRNVVMRQQIKFQVAYKKILKELEDENIFHVTHKDLTLEQIEELKDYFKEELQHAIVPIVLSKKIPFPHLKDSGIYLAVEMLTEGKTKRRMALIQIPKEFPRFYLMKTGDVQQIILLDDIIRLNLKRIFSIFVFDEIKAYTFKFSRDAELDIDDDIALSMMEKISQSVKKRKFGEPVRFVYDEQMSDELLNYLLKNLDLKKGINTIPGGKYHNFKDFMSFPNFGKSGFVFDRKPPIWHHRLINKRSALKEVVKGDVMLHYPYQRFDHVVDLLRESAIDPKVKSIKINIYRVAKKSQIMNALINAVLNGKQVFVVVELQARFDEENNLYWANKLKEAGAKVSFGIESLKVHSKLIQIHREGSKGSHMVSYIGTGNFHEKTANIYEDIGLLTVDPKIGEEVSRIFNILDGFTNDYRFETLLVSPFSTRKVFEELIDNEIQNAQQGKEAFIRIKFNNLVDTEMINLLYKAGEAGVKIDMIVRGICCLVPEKKGLSENIRVRSIVGRYLEHSRYFIFCNGGSPKFFLSSADWMERNLDRRIEVVCPIHSKKIQDRIERIFEIQWKGNVKSRIIDEAQSNRYFRNDNEGFSSQEELYEFYKRMLEIKRVENQTT